MKVPTILLKWVYGDLVSIKNCLSDRPKCIPRLVKAGPTHTVGPGCKVCGLVQEKLTIQEGFYSLTLQQGTFIINMPIWDYVKLTLHPF